MSGVFDPGLQPERTALSWRRTGLTLVAASLLVGRVVAESSGVLGFAAGAAGVGAAIVIVVLGERRYRRQHALLVANRRERVALAAGALPFLVAVLTAMLGAGALVAVILFAGK